jgi:GTP-binding protein HflX
MTYLEVQRIAKKKTIQTENAPEKALLVGIQIKRSAQLWKLKDSLEELALLADTAGAAVMGQITQQVDRATQNYLGKGKLEELKESVVETGSTVVIFDDELTPVQQRNLERELALKVIDRTALILDVFGQHAWTREGKLQVELAQHKYLLPRLAGQWSHLERLGGGIGTRGPGETQIETDRRLIRRRIQKLESDLELVRRHRARYRNRRRQEGVPVLSLVGYTNAGKSTLLNALSKSGVVTADRLFSTLDPVTRRIILPDGKNALLTDTVGFIQKLPTALIASFRATLEELQESDLVLQVIDITHPNAVEHSQVVEGILEELNIETKPRILVLNKIDLLVSDEKEIPDLLLTDFKFSEHPVVMVSSIRKMGLDQLMGTIESELSKQRDAVS